MQIILKKSLAAALSLLMVIAFVPGAAAEQGEKPEDATAVLYAEQTDTPDKEGAYAFSDASAFGEAEQPDVQKEPLPETTDSDVYQTSEARKGSNLFWVPNGGDVVYYPFTPSQNGNYVIYSLSDYDTEGFLLNSNKELIRSDDDNGPGRNFCLYTYTLYGGQTYYIGAGFLDSDRTGGITVRIEEMSYYSEGFTDVFESAYNESHCLADYMMFSKVTPPHTGWYLIYTTGDADTVGVVMGSYRTELGKLEHEIISADDDSGVGRNCRLISRLSEGQEYWIGLRTYSYGVKANYNVVIEPIEYGSALSLGSNAVSVSGRTVNYRPFTAPVTGTYRVYTVSDGDTVGYLKDENYGEILRNDDGPGELDYYFEYNMTAGTTYQIGTRFYESGAAGDVELVIERYDFDGTIEWNANDVRYKGTTPYVIANGSAQTPRFTVKDKNGAVVDPSNYTFYYTENTYAGTGYVIVTMKGGAHTGTIRSWFKIYLPATKTTTVENTKLGVRLRWDPVPGADGYVVYRRAWSGTTNGWTSFERWNNTKKCTWTDTKVYAGSRYQYGVKAYFDRRSDGLTGAMIGGNVGDNYNLGEVGPLRTTVRITSRVLKSLKAGSKKITVSWSPSNKFTGYQIRYATDANFTKNVKSVWIGDPKKSTADLTSLTNGTEYFVSIRSYHKFEGVQYYGEWSPALSVKPGSGKTVKYEPNRALVIGETFYQGSSTELPGSENDMNAVAGILTELNNDFACTKLPSATKAEILSAITSTYAGTTDDSVSVFYFAGHGSGATDEINRGALCTVEGGRITFAELAELLSRVKGRVIVFLSSCLSGGAVATADGADGSIDPEAYDQAILDAFSGYYLDGETGGGTRAGEMRQSKFIVFTATGKDELGIDATFGEDDFNNGYRGHMFGAAFIRSMGCVYPDGTFKGVMPADANSDNQVTVRELYDCLYGQVLNWSTSNPIHVQYYGPDSEVLFRR